MKNLHLTPVRVLIAAAFIAVILGVPAIANLGSWKWKDLSGLLPYRDGLSLSIASERQGVWLLSDATHVYRFDGTSLQDLSNEARNHSIISIANIFSNDRAWLVTQSPADQNRTQVWVTDGNTWTDASGYFPYSAGGLDAAGHDGFWYVRGYGQSTLGAPSEWRLYAWANTNALPIEVQTPNELSRAASGCFRYLDGSTLCTGAGAPVFVNGLWFYVGGSAETRGISGVVIQEAHPAIWKLSTAGLEPVKLDFGNAKYVSGIWSSRGDTLLATSRTSGRPFAADQFWMFDGASLTDVSFAFAEGGLSQSDAREIRAAWNGKSWMILRGKDQFRFDGDRLIALEKTHDAFETVTSNGAGLFVLTGAVSDGEHAFATSPLTAKLVAATEDAKASAFPAGRTLGALTHWLSDETTVFPSRVDWHQDGTSGISWASWHNAKDGVLTTGGIMKYSVAGFDRAGLRSIHVWVNGVERRVCDAKLAASADCSVSLEGLDYGYGTEIFMNANIINTRGKNVWTDGTRIKRDTAPALATAVKQEKQPQPVTSQIFSTTLALEPNASIVNRGSVIHVRTSSQNNTIGLSKVAVYMNGKVVRGCSIGPAMSEVACDADVDTKTYAPGTGLTFMARAEDFMGHEIWSNAKAVTVTEPGILDHASPDTSGINVWEWLTPSVAELSEGQSASYGVGAWSEDGIDRIEIIVDGLVRRACLATSSGNTECSYTLITDDFSHGHTAIVNARITDQAGRVTWSVPRAVQIKRVWTPLPTANAYVTIVPNQTSYHPGDAITFKANAWSPNGVGRIDIFAQGVKVASCPTDVCSWTSPPIVSNAMEYQARLLDGVNQETWTAVQGIRKQ